MFTSEEPTRFGLGCVGSRGLCGALPPERLADLRNQEGQRLDDVRRSAGFRGELAGVRLPPDYYSAFVELHIEQGPILERENVPIGIVTAIAAPAALRVTMDGEGGHAGAVLMPDRRDALCAAAEIVLAVEAAAKATGSPDTVATTGVCRVHPGAINSIPSRVDLEIDVRDVDWSRGTRRSARSGPRSRTSDRRRCAKARLDLLNADPPATMAGAGRVRGRGGVPEARIVVQADGEPGVSRLALHGPHLRHRDDLHPLPRRREPSAGRVRGSGGDRARRRGAGADAGRTVTAV